MQCAPDPEKVREFVILKGLRRPDDDGPILPPEIRFYEQWYPLHEKSMRQEAERQARNEELDRRRRESAKAAAHRAWLMKDMRKWGPENGYFVGTRGRIPRKVIEAYKEVKGI
ncbi:histone-like nucleoid-structuring protein Lsr2 [Streptomyces sp. NPDC058440]|uniref:Lsr2 family DNA-binding protein n=1 Tax=Streptomyces sp. NPDC058440 TaxID=3346501 RepID=UPI00365FC2D6